jgi:hypothetical protein
MATTKLDLDEQFSVNGQVYGPGKGVEMDSDVAKGIKEQQEYMGVQRSYEGAHHGAVPQPSHPQEATAQTPTRPLAAEQVAVDEVVRPTSEQFNARIVKDPGNEESVAVEKADTSNVDGKVAK